jgi:hypothetical protein
MSAERYWEARWRTEKAENEKLQAALREAVNGTPGAGQDDSRVRGGSNLDSTPSTRRIGRRRR